MNNLIPVNYDGEKQTTLARDLFEFLKVETPFRLWFPRMCEYGFSEGIDFTPYIFVHPQNKQEITDYQLTIEMAKEISMLQRTEKGKQARQYFIQLEKQWNSPEALMARALKMADGKIQSLQLQIQADQPYANFGKSIANSSDSITIGEFAKVCNNKGIKIGRNRLFDWMRVNGYLIKQGRETNNPKQCYVEQKLFELKEAVIHTVTDDLIRTTTLLTGKGQLYFLDKLSQLDSTSPQTPQS